MRDALLNLTNTLGLAWWVEIVTTEPRCTYYFGPFVLASEAHTAKEGYIADLQQEGVQGIQVNVKRCQPTELTIYDEGDGSEPLNSYSSPTPISH
jgi:hypothetical protein